MSYEIRNFKPEEFEIVKKWMIQAEWNPGVYDYLAYQLLDQKGFWVGTLNGQPIAALAVVQYDQDFASVAWYIVKKEFRGKGFGFKLWKQILPRINLRNAALNGELQQEQNYKKSGFKTIYELHRYQRNGIQIQYTSPNLIDCRKLDINQLSKYDRENFPAERTKFLQYWINLPESKTIAYVKEKQILGYGVLRKMEQGYSVGPLFAKSYDVAFQIFKNLIGQVPKDQYVQIDTPSINQNSKKLVTQFNMISTYVGARMELRQDIPDYMRQTVYGLTSESFG